MDLGEKVAFWSAAIAGTALIAQLTLYGTGAYQLHMQEKKISPQYAIDYAKKELVKTDKDIARDVLFGYRKALKEYLDKKGIILEQL